MYPTEAILIEKLTKVFNTRQNRVIALENIDLSVKEGEFLCLVGPSGCGKTTLLRILAGLEKQTRGKVIMRSKNPEKPLTSMVFQGDSVFPWMTVVENVAYSLRIRGISAAKRREIAGHYLRLMGLGGF
ncbi:MAG: ATP-binding cassette domain-containing protein, partial [Tepidanaerobacteraceae bacterium]|nr:ATP-binding cassette domain-containing protein [Tepidanaerobacteraceae bacterium]